MSPRTTAVVLAAGRGSRFGGDKLLATLRGRPLLQHALDALADAGVDDPIVVARGDAVRDAPGLTLRAARLVANPDPDRGLASSLQIAWHAAMSTEPAPDAVLVLLGDQPDVSPRVIAAVLAEPLDPARPLVAARYAEGGGHNPVRIERGAERHVLDARGDRGLGPVLESQPSLVRWIDAHGRNPDVDRPSDLAALEASGLGAADPPRRAES